MKRIMDPAEARFWRRVEKKGPDDCWLWQGKPSRGYGRIRIDKDRPVVGAHRYSYELANGPIAEGLVIDHLCRVPMCVNPRHLEPVTIAENTLRGVNPAAQRARMTECANGHPLIGENLIIVGVTRPRRACRTCLRTKRKSRIWVSVCRCCGLTFYRKAKYCTTCVAMHGKKLDESCARELVMVSV